MRILREGWPFVTACLMAAFALGAAGLRFKLPSVLILTGMALAAAGFCAYFFRDPPRVIPDGKNCVLCPADGKVLEIVQGTDPASSEPVWVVRIFLSIFNAHLQRAPITGRVQAIQYKKGKFLDARDPRAAFENEQNRIEIVPLDSESGGVVVTQIAGLIARRIVCWVKPGQVVESGERLGLIRFGSQVDVVFPQKAKLRVQTGQSVTAGDTVLAEM
jgi:phosphatidylserine decarboxylase